MTTTKALEVAREIIERMGDDKTYDEEIIRVCSIIDQALQSERAVADRLEQDFADSQFLLNELEMTASKQLDQARESLAFYKKHREAQG